jgi:chorismate mutase
MALEEGQTEIDPVDAEIAEHRQRIDEIDAEIIGLLAERRVESLEIGKIKTAADRPIIDYGRRDELLRDREDQGRSRGLSPQLIRTIFGAAVYDSECTQLDQRDRLR